MHLTRRRLFITVALASAFLGAALLAALLLDVQVAADGSRHLSVLACWDHASVDRDIFLKFRLPRVLAGAVVGAGLAGAGCAFQATLRNPLAEPYTLGISSGSALAAVLAIRLGLDRTPLGYPGIGLSALLGATATVYGVWRLGRVGRALPAATLLLGGVTVAMFCSAASMLVQYTADFSEVHRMVRWMMGGLEATEYGALGLTAAAVAFGLGILLTLSRPLNALSAGSDAADSVGFAPGRIVTISFVTASLLVGATIALAGPIGFVGLVVPHTVRLLAGPDHRVLLPTAMVCGASLLILCDAVAHLLLAPDQLPVGIVTALLGGPFFLLLLVREKGSASLWSGPTP
jgi:iron complex transport system permease protein